MLTNENFQYISRFFLMIFLVLVTNTATAINTITSKTLGGEERYLVYASTDKPIYRENESLYLRATILNAKDNTPVQSGDVSIAVKIKGPKGEVVFQSNGVGTDSTAGIKWDIPSGTPGGVYTAAVSSPNIGTPETERTFEIRAYRAPRLKNQIEFSREGYGPGDEVQATIRSKRAEGGVPVGAKITVIARVDGQEVFKSIPLTVDDNGIASTVFKLPEEITTGNGSISFIIEDGGVVETASKTLPILLQTMDITFYPEGGDLVTGLANRVYVQAKRPDGKPADIQGRIVAMDSGKPGTTVISDLKTEHEGRGVFTLTPDSGTQYALVLDNPSGIDRHFPLPTAKPRGVVIQSIQTVYAHGGDIAIHVATAGIDHPVTITLHKREVLIDQHEISNIPHKGSQSPTLLNAKDAEGVLIVTAWDNTGAPLAERLIYVKPRFEVNVKIIPLSDTFVPGSTIQLEVQTTDEHGNPVEAVTGITVTDDAVLELIEKREQAPRLPVMVYLENDVIDLADAHVYLDNKNPKASLAVDLLLGTQGWRRFILKEYSNVKNAYPLASKRVMAERVIVPKHPFKKGRVFAMPMAAMAGNMIAEGAAAPLEKRKKLAVKAKRNIDLQNVAPRNIAQKNIAPRFQLAEAPVAKQEKLQFEMEDDIAGIRDDFMMARVAQVMVREYAYQSRPNRRPSDRVDFTETLYWHSGIHTNARDGKATIEFDLSDSVTGFRVMADSFGRNGALGSSDLVIHSLEPFFIEPKMPLEITVGDVIELPIALINATDKNLKRVSLIVKGEGVSITQPETIVMNGGERVRQIVRIEANQSGEFPLTITASAAPYSDSVTRMLIIKPKGFPVSVNKGGLIGPEQAFHSTIEIPSGVEIGSINAIAKVYPSPLASMEEALNALLRQPNGCFEQTSSTSYPLVMAQQYFLSHQGVSPEKIAKAKSLLDAGYKKLIGFESADKGYEWFGGNPAHESLTAYGLMEFVDMSKVMAVDQTMIKRTRNWLLSRRDGEGGFKQNKKALDSFGRAPIETTNAYIVWALLESGEDPIKLKKEIHSIKEKALTSDDSYVVALAANILYLANDHEAATALSKKLVAAVITDGSVGHAVTTITRSGGDALSIETTSLALLAWLKDDSTWAADVENSIKWLFERSKSGRFGSTQSTILALKAINAYDAARAQPKQPGLVQLYVDGIAFGKPVMFTKDTKGAIELPDFSAALSIGKHSLELKMENGSKMPFSLEIQYHTQLPLAAIDSPVRITSNLSGSTFSEGEPVEMKVVISAGVSDAPTPIAILGVPAGIEVRHDQLKELVTSKQIDSYEVKGQTIILYWRALKAEETRNISIDLIAAIPGIYTGQASRSYLYYTDEMKFWEKGHTVTIEQKN